MANEMPGYSSGAGESLQTALPQRGTLPTPSATDPQAGFGTDYGLAGGLGPPVRPNVGTPLAGDSSRGSTSASASDMAMGTDSGLASSATSMRQSNL
jgi:hypothetical protein